MGEPLYIGVDMGGTHIRAALADGQGRLFRRLKVKTAAAQGADETSARLIDVCRRLMSAAAEWGDAGVRSVGLGVAGKIDPVAGRVLFSPNLPAMADYPLVAVLRRELGVDVVLDNDANVFGLGEAWQGLGRGVDNWLGITLGTGVGGCLIMGGRLWQGDHLGFVGEIGHMVIVPGGPRCACGLNGCLEALASGSALVQGVEQAVGSGRLQEGLLFEAVRHERLEAHHVHEAAAAGESVALELLTRMGWALGLAIAAQFTVLGICHAIIGGGVSAAWDQFSGALHQSLAAHSSMLDPERMVVRRSRLGDDASLLGAVKLAVNRDVSRRWPTWDG